MADAVATAEFKCYSCYSQGFRRRSARGSVAQRPLACNDGLVSFWHDVFFEQIQETVVFQVEIRQTIYSYV